MDFDDTTQEAAFRAEARAFLEKHLPYKDKKPLHQRLDAATFLKRAKAWQATKAKARFAQITWPKEMGGRGGTAMQGVIWAQEEARFDAPVGPFTIGLGMCIPTLIAFGSDTQKARHVRKALHGEEIWCQLFSEPAAGSDVAGVKTRAVRHDDMWVINGQKAWISGAHYSDYGILLARTDPKVPKHKGLTMFSINMKQAGIEIRPIHQASDAHDFNEVYFTDARIPDSDRLGAVGDGWKVAIVTLMNERLAIGDTTGPDWRQIMDHARQTGMLADTAFREMLADWYVAARGHELTKLRTQTALSKGQTPGPENSIGKLVTASQLQDICNTAIEMQGHYGVVTDDNMFANGAFQKGFMWAAGLRIAGGTDEILKNIIAERVLGLPQDVRLDKDIPFDQTKQG